MQDPPRSPVSELIKAIRDNNLEQLKALIAGGADINEQDAFGVTPLIESMYFDHKEIALFLIEQPDINLSLISYQHGSALTCACGYEDQEIVKALLTHMQTFSHDEHIMLPKIWTGCEERV